MDERVIFALVVEQVFRSLKTVNLKVTLLFMRNVFKILLLVWIVVYIR